MPSEQRSDCVLISASRCLYRCLWYLEDSWRSTVILLRSWPSELLKCFRAVKRKKTLALKADHCIGTGVLLMN